MEKLSGLRGAKNGLATATQVGLVLGQCVSAYDTQVLGISVAMSTEAQRARVLDLARRTAAEVRRVEAENQRKAPEA